MGEIMKKFFYDDNNKLSMARLLSMITCFTGLAIGIIVAIKANANIHTTTIATSFVSIGCGLKLLQKLKESK